MDFKNKNKLVFSFIFFTVLIFVFIISKIQVFQTLAQSNTSELSGYAWSENIGWISFASSTNAYNLVGVDSSGNLNGYAWSENIGWIKFGDVGGLSVSSHLGFDFSWTERIGAGSRHWLEIASSVDGAKLAALASQDSSYYSPIVTSSDSGVTWVSRTIPGTQYIHMTSITSSSDGSKLMVAGNYSSLNGYIYTSSDSGVTWTKQLLSLNSNGGWRKIISSADGNKIFALSEQGRIYTSIDGGATFSERVVAGAVPLWYYIAASSDGTKLAGTNDDGYIYTSSDSGVTWTKRINLNGIWGNWISIMYSPDGGKLFASYVDYDNESVAKFFVSTNSGATWTEKTALGASHWFSSIVSSSDGAKLVGLATWPGMYTEGYIYTSSDSGATWVEQTSAGSKNWAGIISSADGEKLSAFVSDPMTPGYIYTSLRASVGGQDMLLTSNDRPKIINTNELTGWARACAGTVGGDCNSVDRTDGWDGWIKLDGVVLNGSHTYAWGSDVMGWIDFSQVILTNNDVCSNIPGNQTSLPANTELSAGACTCLASTPPGQLSQNVLNGGCTCLNGGAWNGTTCIQVCTATTLITKISPAFVATPSDVCTLTWNVTNYENGGDNGVCPLRSVSCVFDGTTEVTSASSTGVSMPIGTHTLVCGDGYATSTKSVKCKLSPSYGEF